MLDILYTINSDAKLELVKEPKKWRELTEEEYTQQLIEITPDYWSEIFRFVKIKAMKIVIVNFIVNKNRRISFLLLKKSAILIKKRKNN